MVEKESVFLNTAQALDAICIDFRQYAPQIFLFCAIMPLISRGSVQLIREKDNAGVWLSRTGHRNMKWLKTSELPEYMCKAITDAKIGPEKLAEICSRVFQSRAVPFTNPDDGEIGVRIDTGMENFVCRQCGRCCRQLEYRNDLTSEDIALWKSLGREDILKRVGIVRKKDRSVQYRMWVKIGSRELVDTCPFLKKLPDKNKWICTIQDVKPQICRHYPMTRKHALMTGCLGFEGYRQQNIRRMLSKKTPKRNG